MDSEVHGRRGCVLMCNAFVNSYWEAPSKETGLRWHWKLGNDLAQFSSCCLMNYALHLEQLNKGYTGSNSKRASFCTTWAKAMSFSCWSVFFLVTFFERVLTVFFRTYLWSARRVSSNHHVSFEETSEILLTPPGCVICSPSSRIFGPKCKVSEEHGFIKKATVSP